MAVTKKKSRKKTIDVVKKTKGLIPGPNDLVEPSDNLLDYYIAIHGVSGIGKTSIMSSIPGCVVAQFEPARRNIKIRQVEFRIRTPEELSDGAECPYEKFISFLEEAKDDPTVKVIGIDNIAECYRAFANRYLFDNDMVAIPKNDYGASYNQINRMFESVFNGLKHDSKLGVIFTCHTKEREAELNTGTTEQVYGPAVPAGVLDYLKKAMDFAFYYGWHNNQRALHCRWESIWTKCGSPDRFLDLKGKPLNAFVLPNDPSKSWETVLKAWNNKVKGISQD